MKVAVFNEKKKITIENREKPEPGENQVLVKVKASGLCGTDIHIFQGEAPAEFPVIPGHEFSGEIVEIGENVDKVSNGDKVAINPNIHCGHCFYCQRGEIHMCTDLQAVGVTRDGGFAEYVVVPQTQVHLLDKDISYEEGAMIEPLSCCLHGIDIANIAPGDKVVILGGGAIGLILAQLAEIAGALEVIVSEPSSARRELAREIGINNIISPENLEKTVFEKSEIGADVVIEAVGIESTIRQSFEIVRKRGSIILFGVAPEDLEVSFSPFSVFQKELTVKGSRINPFVTERAVKILNSGKIEVGKLITNIYNLEKLPKILEGKITDTGLKTLITF